MKFLSWVKQRPETDSAGGSASNFLFNLSECVTVFESGV